jgi:hypothetical protein
MATCPYKDFFGRPREGAHAIRIPILDIALVDTAATVALAAAIAWVTGLNFLLTLAVLFVLGVVAHKVFCVRTQVVKPTCNCMA